MPASTRRSSIAHEPTRSPSGPLSTTDARTREAARENPQAGCGPGGGTDGAPDGTGRSTSGRAIVAHDGCAPASVSPSAPAPNLPNTFTSGVATAHGLPPNRHACCPHHGAGAARVTQIIIIIRKKILLPIKNEWELDSRNQLAEISSKMQYFFCQHLTPRTILSIGEITKNFTRSHSMHIHTSDACTPIVAARSRLHHAQQPRTARPLPDSIAAPCCQ